MKKLLITLVCLFALSVQAGTLLKAPSITAKNLVAHDIIDAPSI